MLEVEGVLLLIVLAVTGYQLERNYRAVKLLEIELQTTRWEIGMRLGLGRPRTISDRERESALSAVREIT